MGMQQRRGLDGPAAEVTAAVKAVQDQDQLDSLVEFAARCDSLEAFRARLQS